MKGGGASSSDAIATEADGIATEALAIACRSFGDACEEGGAEGVKDRNGGRSVRTSTASGRNPSAWDVSETRCFCAKWHW